MAPEPAGPTAPSPGRGNAGPDSIRRVTNVLLVVVVVSFAWHLVADRLTPYSNVGVIDAYVLPVAAQVSGYLEDVDVVLNQQVNAGQIIMRINPRPYELAVESARANLALSRQQMRAQVAGVSSAAGRLGVARAQFEVARRNYARVESISRANPGALAQADVDRYQAALAEAESQVASARAELARAREQLGLEGEDNAAIQAAIAALETAEFQLEQTVIRAPTDGIIADLQIAEGYFASAGAPLATFISTKDVWIRSNMRENNLGRVEIGAAAEVVLDMAPGRVFSARVASLGSGVATGAAASRGNLPTSEESSGWFRKPERFPVVLRFVGDGARGYMRVGGQVSAIIYTDHNPILNAVGWLRIRLESLLSYVN